MIVFRYHPKWHLSEQCNEVNKGFSSYSVKGQFLAGHTYCLDVILEFHLSCCPLNIHWDSMGAYPKSSIHKLLDSQIKLILPILYLFEFNLSIASHKNRRSTSSYKTNIKNHATQIFLKNHDMTFSPKFLIILEPLHCFFLDLANLVRFDNQPNSLQLENPQGETAIHWTPLGRISSIIQPLSKHLWHHRPNHSNITCLYATLPTITDLHGHLRFGYKSDWFQPTGHKCGCCCTKHLATSFHILYHHIYIYL